MKLPRMSPRLVSWQQVDRNVRSVAASRLAVWKLNGYSDTKPAMARIANQICLTGVPLRKAGGSVPIVGLLSMERQGVSGFYTFVVT